MTVACSRTGAASAAGLDRSSNELRVVSLGLPLSERAGPTEIIVRTHRLHHDHRRQDENDLNQRPGRENPTQQRHDAPQKTRSFPLPELPAV